MKTAIRLGVQRKGPKALLERAATDLERATAFSIHR
jgi:hypothetical protein